MRTTSKRNTTREAGPRTPPSAKEGGGGAKIWRGEGWSTNRPRQGEGDPRPETYKKPKTRGARTRKEEQRTTTKGGGGATTRRRGPGHQGPETTESRRQRGHKARETGGEIKARETEINTNSAAPVRGGGEPRERPSRTAKGKVRRTKTRPGARPRRPGEEEHAHAPAHGIRACVLRPVPASTRNSPGAPAEYPVEEVGR